MTFRNVLDFCQSPPSVCKIYVLCGDIGCRTGNGIIQCSPFSQFSISYATSYVLARYCFHKFGIIFAASPPLCGHHVWKLPKVALQSSLLRVFRSAEKSPSGLALRLELCLIHRARETDPLQSCSIFYKGGTNFSEAWRSLNDLSWVIIYPLRSSHFTDYWIAIRAPS